jgi:hypothetical protein
MVYIAACPVHMMLDSKLSSGKLPISATSGGLFGALVCLLEPKGYGRESCVVLFYCLNNLVLGLTYFLKGL